jgi:citrate synthase
LAILNIAHERGIEGPHIAMLYTICDALPEAIGSTLPINVNDAIPARSTLSASPLDGRLAQFSIAAIITL